MRSTNPLRAEDTARRAQSSAGAKSGGGFPRTGRTLVPILAALAALSALASWGAPTTVNGRIVLAAGRGAWFTSEGRERIACLQPDASLRGTSALADLRRGDRIEVSVAKEVAGVLIADEIRAEPPVLIDPVLTFDLAELARRIDRKDPITLLDTRDPAEFAAGHLPGAMSAPADTLASRLPKDRKNLVVFYGESVRDGRPHQALREAHRLGYPDVRVCREGIRGWDDLGRYLVMEPSAFDREQTRPRAVVDLRNPDAFAAGHIPGAYLTSVEKMSWRIFSSALALPDTVFCAADDTAASRAARRTLAWRPDQEYPPHGHVLVLRGGFDAYRKIGRKIEKGPDSGPPPLEVMARGQVPWTSVLPAWQASGGKPLFVDVRSRTARHYDFVREIPLHLIPFKLADLPKRRRLVLYCNWGRQSAIAREILALAGLDAVYVKGPPPSDTR